MTSFSRFRRVLPGTVLLACCAFGTARAQNEARLHDPAAQAAIMHVGFINPDCVRDTVYGLLDPELRWIPRFICFGNTVDAEGNALCESEERSDADNASRNERLRRNDTAFLVYPGWQDFSCVLSVQRYNANDTLDDLIFWMRGADSVPQRGRVDTARSLVLFGQAGLETHRQVDLGSVGAFRSEPFYAMELTKGRELINPKKRDMTRRASRELVRVDRQVLEGEEEVRDTGNVPAPQITSAVAGDADAAFSARVYPNPAVYTANIEIAPLPPGTYTVNVVAVNGEEVWRGEVVLTQTGQVFQRIDLGGLAAGYYVLRVGSAEKAVGAYPIIVVR